MANSTKKRVKIDASEYVVYKVGVAFVLLFLILTGLRRLGRYYSTIAGFEKVYPVTLISIIVFAVLFAAAAAAGLLLKKKALKKACLYVVVLSLLGLITAVLLRKYWTNQMTLIYFLHAFIYCLYMVLLLYQWEFFFYSFATVLSGYIFFRLSKGYGANAQTVIPLLILAAGLAAVVLIAWQASKKNGTIKIGKKTVVLFPASFKPTFLYVICGFWALLMILSLFIGYGFAYYCIFAAIAFELIAAVYYTFQLK